MTSAAGVGAAARDTLWLVLREGLLLAALAVILGLPVAFALGQVLRSLLFGLSPADPATFAGAVLLLLAVALAACYVPARRATRVDPVIALRCE